jgi:hypothetical protein
MAKHRRGTVRVVGLPKMIGLQRPVTEWLASGMGRDIRVPSHR